MKLCKDANEIPKFSAFYQNRPLSEISAIQQRFCECTSIFSACIFNVSLGFFFS